MAGRGRAGRAAGGPLCRESEVRCRAGTPPIRLEVSATVTFQQIEGGWKVASSALTVKGEVACITAEAFAETAEAAKDGCLISGALKGNVDLSIETTLA